MLSSDVLRSHRRSVLIMYDKFVLRNLEEGIIRGYSWHLEDPEKVICIVHGIENTAEDSIGWRKLFAIKIWQSVHSI